MAIVNFTVDYDHYASADDSDDVGLDADVIVLTGPVKFTPQFRDARPALAPDYSPRPAGFTIREFTGFVDTDGRLKSARGGSVGVRLWANDPVFNLQHLWYKVEFNLTTLAGDVVPVQGGYFEAPTTDTAVQLAEVLQQTGSGSPGITKGLQGDEGPPGDMTTEELNDAIAAAVNAVINGAPGALDTLNELAAALGDDANFATTVTNALAGKQPLDADLTAIAALTTATFGRSLLTTTDAAAARTTLDAQGILPVGYYTPVGKPDGAITAFDSGQTVYTFGGSVGEVVSEEIVHTPTGVPSATYYEMDAGARVWRIGCQAKWPLSATGAATLVLPITPWGPPGGHPSGASAAGSVAGIHLSVFGNGIWYQSRWNVGSQTIFADYTTHGRFPTVWGDGEFHDIEVWIDPDKGEGRLFVDGWSSKVFSNVTIADDTGDWAVWEQFNTLGAGEVACTLQNMWVDTQPRRLDAFVATKADIADAVDAVSSDAYEVATVTTSGGSTALTNDSATFQLLAGSASHTIVLPTTDVPQGRLFIVQNASTGVITVNASGGGFVTALASGGTGYFISVTTAPTTAGNWLALPLVTTTAVQTMTGKSLVQPIMRGLATVTAASGSSVTPVVTTANLYAFSALAANLTINAPSGTPADGHQFDFRFKDDGTPRTLTWNAIYNGPVPTVTITGKTTYVQTRYNVATTKYDVVGVWTEGFEVAALGSIELGHASDTTIARSGAGDITVEGNAIYRAGGTDVSVTDGGTGRSTSTTAYGLLAAGTTATGAQQTLPAGATTEVLVGGGASALPVWTTATGTGAPVRANSPALVTPTGIVKSDISDINTVTANRQTASYTLVLGDAGKAVEMNVGSANNLTVPLNSSVAFPTGTIIEIGQYGAGQTTVVATGGVTIRSSGGKLKLTGQYSGASLRKIGADEWWLVGDIAA